VPAGASHDEVVRLYAAILDETWELWRTERRWVYVAERLRLLADRLGLKALDADLLGWQFHVEAGNQLRLLDGAVEALAAARRGRRTALLTNGRPEIQRPKIERFGLQSAVDFVGVTGEIGHWKPDPRAFRAVLDRLGVEPGQAVMVGDALDFDITPAKRLGLRTVWVNGSMPAHHADADLVIPNPLGLLPHL
jgi:HAD superfamily hydrolase (TIGR01509 family)